MLWKSFAKDFDEKISSFLIDFSSLPRHPAIHKKLIDYQEKKLRWKMASISKQLQQFFMQSLFCCPQHKRPFNNNVVLIWPNFDYCWMTPYAEDSKKRRAWKIVEVALNLWRLFNRGRLFLSAFENGRYITISFFPTRKRNESWLTFRYLCILLSLEHSWSKPDCTYFLLYWLKAASLGSQWTDQQRYQLQRGL